MTFKQKLITLVAAATILLTGFLANASERLTLEEGNTLSLRLPVDSNSVADLEQKALDMSAKLDKTDTIYLVLSTPGGSIDSGNHLIAFLKGLPQRVITVTVFAASMGFHIVESLDDRLIVDNGTLMSHRASLGLEGELRGEFDTRLNMIRRTVDRMDEKVCKRAGYKFNKYQDMIHDELWMLGAEAVTKRFADKVVSVSCGKSLNGKVVQQLDTMFGPLDVTWSKCPLITDPLKVAMPSDEGLLGTELKAYQDMKNYINKMLFDRESFLQEYIITGKFSKLGYVRQ